MIVIWGVGMESKRVGEKREGLKWSRIKMSMVSFWSKSSSDSEILHWLRWESLRFKYIFLDELNSALA